MSFGKGFNQSKLLNLNQSKLLNLNQSKLLNLNQSKLLSSNEKLIGRFYNYGCKNLGLRCHINPLPNEKILDKSKLKAFTDDKLKMIQMAKFVLDQIENIVGKEENAGLSAFFFPFPRLLSQGR